MGSSSLSLHSSTRIIAAAAVIGFVTEAKRNIVSGRIGAVDADLVARGRLRLLDRATLLRVERRTPTGQPPTRDPAQLLDTMFGGASLAR